MKKIALFLVLMTTLLSCSVDQPESTTSYVLPVDSYTMPSTFVVGGSYEVKLSYQKPTACYNYGGIYYYADGNTRTIGVYANVKNGETCSEELPPLSEVSFVFSPTAAGTYVFKFYKGNDSSGANVFEDVEVVVTE